MLDDYVNRLRDAHPDIDEQSPRQKAGTAAQFLLSHHLIGIPEEREYHNIEHNFLGRALFSPHRHSLPIITVIIYCYILRQLGLRAAPCSFPLHVHAIVYPPRGLDFDGGPIPADITTSPQPMYMDPFRTASEIPISSLHEQLHFLARHLSDPDHNAFLSASNPREITIRCARNILNSLQQSTELPAGRPIDPVSAHYAALWALVLLPTSIIPLRQHLLLLMHVFSEKFPHDVGLVEQHILPLTSHIGVSEHAQMCRSVRMADLNCPASVKRRVGNNEADGVKYKVGQLFRHKRYGYVAVVTGWDGRCEQGEEWIGRMGVDRLDGGREQAFYHAL
jgi:F-box protein 21